MKKLNVAIALLLTISITIPMFATIAFAVPVDHLASGDSTHPNIIKWINYTDYQTLLWNPEYLKLRVVTGVPIMTECQIIVQGKDARGADIEAKVILHGNHTKPITNQYEAVFCDMHTDPPVPVAFAQITGILQQNATDGNRFEIWTEPAEQFSSLNPLVVANSNYPFQQFLGEAEPTNQWYPTTQVGHGYGTIPTTQDVTVYPANPDPVKIIVNWQDNSPTGIPDLYPNLNPPTEAGHPPATAAGLDVEGLDAMGNKQTVHESITAGQNVVYVDDSHAWSTVCAVETTSGGSSDSFYIFTHPMPARSLFQYTVLLDHLTIHPDSYDILAYPGVIDGYYPGVTNITVALRDIDGNLVHWGGGTWTATTETPPPDTPIVLNFYSSGGRVGQSNEVKIFTTNVIARVNLTADTNARTITVTCDAEVPPTKVGLVTFHGWLNLFVWTDLAFDGINSVNSYVWGDWPIKNMQWGYTDASGVPSPAMDVPAKPVLPPELGGPAQNGIKLDGPVYQVSIPLFVGCNLISSPVHPILGNYYYSGYPSTIPGTGTLPSITIDNQGIPMYKLFNYTSARDTIEAIWWYTADSAQVAPSVYSDGWQVYVPGVTTDTGAYFTDGVGYWFKAEKPCTLELSGIFMENGPFTPPTYQLRGNAWNLVGVTSVTGIKTSDYLESTMGSTTVEAAGPEWLYINPGLNAQGTSVYPPAFQTGWIRDPLYVYPGQAFWVYNKVPANQYIAP